MDDDKYDKLDSSSGQSEVVKAMKNKMLAYFFVLMFGAIGCISSTTLSTPLSNTPTSDSKVNATSTKIPTTEGTPIIAALTSPPPVTNSVSKDKSEITLELLRTNNDCELPCWWGITPNQTQWKEAEFFLRSFSKITSRQSPDWFVYYARSPIEKIYSDVSEVRSTFAVQNGVVKEIEITSFNESTYHLSNFLQRVGIPELVLISTYSSDYGTENGTVPMTVALYYPNLGIMATYGSWANLDGTFINGCLDKSPTLFLWSPQEYKREIEYILRWDFDHVPYLPIEDATNLDNRAFYENFSNNDISPCLATPITLWPKQ